MILKEKIKVCRFKSYWKKHGRKDLFTWVHRYLRLHSELLEDGVYQNMYDYHRNTLITYLKNDIKDKKADDIKLGKLVDMLADIFNEKASEQVNKCKPLVDELYKFWKKSEYDK